MYGQGKQEPGTPSNKDILALPSKKKKTSTAPSKRPSDHNGTGTHKEVLTNSKENHPEYKFAESDQVEILDELEMVFRRTPKGELVHLRSFRPKRGAVIYVCAYRQSGHWLRVTDNHSMGSGARLKTTNARTSLRLLRRLSGQRIKLLRVLMSY
jgi:hypothetical protein